MRSFNPKKIRERRMELKITQTALAKKAKIARGYLNDIEFGRSVPTVTVLSRIASALNVRESYFFSED